MPLPINHYLQHLTDLNQSQAVTASEDIYNQFGVLLVAKGSRINPKAQAQLQQHRLAKEIDGMVALERTLSDQQIYQQILALLAHNPVLAELQQANHFEDRLRHICLSGDLPLSIRQALTVMEQRLADLFEHSLFDAWAAALIANEMGLPPAQCRQAYVCGLIHDIGLLHLPAEVRSQSPLSADNWRGLQSHVVIGQRCADAAGLAPEIGQAVLEHHERLDQSGYPTRKPAHKLGLLGQIVASVDLLDRLFRHELSHQTTPAGAALPYFKVHRNSFNQAIHSALMRILARANAETSTASDHVQPVNLERVREVNQRLTELLQPLGALRAQAEAIAHPALQGLLNMLHVLTEMAHNSGICDPQLSAWLQAELDPHDPDNHGCLVEIDAMQYELLWLVKRLGWILQGLLESNAGLPPAALDNFRRYQETALAQLGTAFARYAPASGAAPESPDTP